MLWKFTNTNKYGNLRSRIVYRPNGEAFGFNPKGFGPFVHVRTFRYTYNHPLYPPSLFVNQDGKKFIMPTWQKVLPETTLEDINWVKPKVKRAEVFEHKFKSSSNDKVYTTKEHVSVDGSRKYTCNCPGSWMAKDKSKGCKHQQQLMSRHLESKQMKK